MIKFNVPYINRVKFPIKASGLFEDVCDQVGLEAGNTDFINADYMILGNPFTNNENCKTVLSNIAKLAGGFARIGRDNKPYIVSLKNISYLLKVKDVHAMTVKDLNLMPVKMLAGTQSNADESLDGNNYFDDFTKNDQWGEVNSLILRISGIEGENSVEQDDESIKENGLTELVIEDNYFLINQTEREKAIVPLWNALKGIKYLPFKTKYYGYPYLDAGDLIYVEDINGNGYLSYVFNHTFTFNGGFSGEIETPALTKTQTAYKNTSNAKTKFKQVERKIDKINGIIEDIIEEQDETSQKLTQHEQTINGMKDTISNTSKVLDELSKDIQVYSADLDIYNITIPVDENKNPLEDKDYEVNFYTYFKGSQVTSNAATTSTNTGITCTIDKTIKFSVKANTKITNLNNAFVISFIYQEGKEVYTVSKKIVLTLSLKGSKGDKGETGEKGDAGAQGIPGANGADGTSYYFYVRYSANSTGNPMTTTPTSSTEYMGVASTTAKTAPTSYSAYTWSKIKGEDGENGSPGQNGANGETSYLHIKYSDDGKTFTTADDVFAEGERPGAYLGQYTDFVKEDSTSFDDYTWYKFTQDIDPILNDLQSQTQQNATDIANNYQDIINKVGDLATQESVVSLEKRLEVVKTDTDMTISAINDIQVNGVSKVTTETGFAFNDKGLTIDKTGAKTKANLNEAGLNIQDATGSTDESLLFAGYDEDAGETIVKTKNMTVEKYLVVGAYSRFEDYTDENGNAGTGCFWIAE